MKRPWIKECALAHSRAEARLPRQPSTLAPSAHPRGAFLSYGNEVSYTIIKNVPWRILVERLLSYGNEVSYTKKRMCQGTFSRRGAVASATIYPCAECASSRSVYYRMETKFPYDNKAETHTRCRAFVSALF